MAPDSGDAHYSVVDSCIVASAEVWRDDDEVLASGFGVIPRLGALVAARTLNPLLMVTDSESSIVSEPIPIGVRTEPATRETRLGFAKAFSNVWSGRRHALISPAQVDRFGQANISCIGKHAAPKVQLVGARGLPGNSIYHRSSFFISSHSRRCFVSGEVDVVCSLGYNPDRLPRGYGFADIDIHRVVTNLCVMDFNGQNRSMRVVSLHPGVTLEEVRDNTGFDLQVSERLAITPDPTDEQNTWIHKLDPLNLRSKALRY